jgi:hypothetical protein
MELLRGPTRWILLLHSSPAWRALYLVQRVVCLSISPLTIFAITGFVKAFRKPDTAHRTIYLVFFLFIGDSIACVSKWAMWWGGFSYGPRLLAEVQPFLLLSSVPTCKTIFERRQPKLGMLAFFLLFAWSCSTQVLGAYVPSDWNWAPKSVDEAPGRVWDWGDNPTSRSLHVIERFLASHLLGANPHPASLGPKFRIRQTKT